MYHSGNTGGRKAALLAEAAIAGFLLVGFSASAAAAQEARPLVEELVVTATKRAMTVQDAPVAVTAIDGAELERRRVQTFADLAPLVPGARFNSTKGSVGQIVLRGQYTVNDSPALEVPVGTFIDEMYYGTLGSFDADFFDIEQIAVLRGPQGTTFGRNTVGGAIQVTSRRPDFGGFSGYASLTASTVPGFETRGAVNLPINERWAGRVAFSTHNVDGWKNNYNGAKLEDKKSFSVRTSLRYQPNDQLDANLSLSWYHKDSLGPAARLFGQGSLIETLNALYDERTDVYSDNNGYDRRDAGAAVLTVNYDTGAGTLTSVTGYRALDGELSEDIDGTPAPVLIVSNRMQEWAFSQEVRFVSPPNERLEYVVGAYYSFESLFKAVTQANRGGSNPQSALSIFTQGQDQYQIPEQRARVLTLAPFGEVEFHLSDQVSVVGGIRYTYEDKDGFTNHIGSSVFYGGPFAVNFGKTWDAWTPRFILNFEPTDDIHLYASAAKGFKGGGWSLVSTSAAAAVIPLEPETSWSYEVGAKTQWFDGAAIANIAIYQANTENLQVRSLSNGVFTDINAGEAEVKGVELEGVWNVTSDAYIGVNYAYTDATYKSFPNCTAAGLDCTGNRIPYTPKHDLMFNGSLGVDLPQDRGRLTLSGDLHFQSEVYFTPQNLNPGGDFAPTVDASEINGLLNLSVLFEPADGRWDARLWVRNATDLHYMKNYANFFFYILTPGELVGGLTQAGRVYYAQPRSAGITLTYRM